MTLKAGTLLMPAEHQNKRELLEAAEAALARGSASGTVRSKFGRPSETHWGLVLTCALILTGSGGAVLMLRPEWAFRAPPAPETPALAGASLRLAIVRERQRVEAYLREHGSLPVSLTEAGGTLPGLQLLPGPGTAYLLRHGSGAEMLELRSTDSLEVFLGNSLQEILTRGGKP